MNEQSLRNDLKQIVGMLKAVERDMPDTAEMLIQLSSLKLSLGKFCLALSHSTGIHFDII